ncbi:MAG: DUF3298 and DUF4163 domain-containing protein [Luteimonas sp.]
MNRFLVALSLATLSLANLSACQRENAAQQGSAPAPAGAPAPVAPPVAAPAPLEDVIERDPRYMIGISYPPVASKYPGLAAELRQYAEAARADIKDAVHEMGDRKPTSPYELSLSFNTVVDTPQIVAIAADGSSYTGGAHGNPLVARFVWLPGQDKSLKSGELITGTNAWRDISDYVREQLRAALSQRVDADELPPAERADVVRSGLKMIDEGTKPQVDAFDQFEPVLGADGKITALRFVFPPYQIGPYVDGTQTMDVPAHVLLPYVATAYRSLFATSPDTSSH